MTNDFMRIVTQTRVLNYMQAETVEEKLSSDLVADLRRHSQISVFMVGGTITAERIAAAVAAARRKPGTIDYILFDMGTHIAVQCDGDTPDKGVNAVHYNVASLGDDQIIEFADMLVNNDVLSISGVALRNAIMDSVRRGYMSKDRVSSLD